MTCRISTSFVLTTCSFPRYTNRLGWSRGYFENVDSRPLSSDDLLEQHCFRRHTGQYFDEKGQQLPGPVEPCGDWVLSSFLRIDDLVSEAIGIPLAPSED